MPRADLLALTPEDLAALSNRGIVKRAQRELESAEVTFELNEADDGTITVKWSDNVECSIPGRAVVARGRCTCPATELCRHLIRLVLAYQKQFTTRVQASATAEVIAAAETPAPPPNDPSTITDEELTRYFKPAALQKARGLLQQGLLVEVVRGQKPTVRFHDFSCTLRFVVSGDVRYAHCDCAEEAPCSHVPLAVWAFRLLPADAQAKVFSTQPSSPTVPVQLLDDIEAALREVAERGISSSANDWRDRLCRLEISCRQEGLVWPAEILAEVVQEYERYQQRDARFDSAQLARLVGELLIRSDAIRNDTGAVPQALIRGMRSDQATEISSARYVGLGCGAKVERKAVTLTVYLQDADSGSLVAVSREFPDPADSAKDAMKFFWQLAQTPALKGTSYANLGGGQLLLQGGKRTAEHRLVVGRARASFNPQAFAWESLRAPVLAADFAEVRNLLTALPPSSLRPRRVAEDFHVCPVARVEHAAFDHISQTVRAVVKDAQGEGALVQHPYLARGSEGAERLVAGLSADGAKLRFVAGPIRLGHEGLVISPVALVFQEGTSRSVVQPWIDRCPNPAGEANGPSGSGQASSGPLVEYVGELEAAIGETLVLGLMRADARVTRTWLELARVGEATGFSRMAHACKQIPSRLAEKAATVRWNSQPAINTLLELAVLSRLAQDCLR